MRAWLWTVPLAVVAACSAACGGDVIVDGAGTATSSSSSGGTSSGTGGTCQTTCLEAIKQGGGVCQASVQALGIFNQFVGCASSNCGGACGDVTASGASAGCLDCMSGPCAIEIMSCTGS